MARVKVIEIALEDELDFVAYGGDPKSVFFENGWRAFTANFAHPDFKSLETIRCSTRNEIHTLFAPIDIFEEGMKQFFLGSNCDAALISSLQKSVLNCQPVEEQSGPWSIIRRDDGTPLNLEMVVFVNSDCDGPGYCRVTPFKHIDLVSADTIL